MDRQKQNELFTEWLRLHDSILWKIARSYAPPDEQEHLHHDLMVAVWRAVPLYRDASKASTYIYRVGVNCALNWSRTRKRYSRRHVEIDGAEATVAKGPVQGGSEQERRVERLYTALHTLPPADRSLMLMHLDGRSYQEIADVLGITQTNVGVKLNRLRNRLAQQLQCLEQTEKDLR